MSAPPITLDEQIACVAREIRMRRQVYPRWVEAHRMSQAQADHQLAAMTAVLENLQAQRPAAPEQGALL